MNATQRLLLVSITLIGAFLRFFHLGANSFWMDEMATWYYSSGPTFADWFQRYDTSKEPFPGTYYFFNFIWTQVFGVSEAALRTPSAIAGTLAVPAMYFLGRRLGSVRLGLVAAAFCAVNFRAVAISQDARPYAFLFLFSILLGIAVLGLLRTPARIGDQVLLVFASVGLSQLHYMGFFLFFLGVSFLLVCCYFERRKPPQGLWWSLGVSLLLYGPWLFRLLQHVVHSPANENIRSRSLYKMGTSYFKFSYFSDDVPAHFATSILYWALFALLMLAIVYALKTRRKDWLLVVGWLTLPFLALWLKSELSQPMYRARYLTISLPAMIVVVPATLTLLFGEHSKKYLWVSGLFVMLWAGHLILEDSYYGAADTRRIRNVFQEFGAVAAMQENLQFWTCTPRPIYFSYYLEQEPELKKRWIGKERCVAERPQGEGKLAVVFSQRPPDESFSGEMESLGWRLEKKEVAVDYELFVFRGSK